MDQSNLSPRSDFPHIPAKSNVQPDSNCNGCALKQAAGHKTCGLFGPSKAASDSERLAVQEIRGAQWIVQRKQYEAEGIAAAEGFKWYRYNAEGSFNFHDFASFEVEAVSGNTITLKTFEGADPRQVRLYSWRERDKQTGLKWVNGFYRLGAPCQPGDVIRFSANSVLSSACWPIITRVLEVDVEAGTIKVETDKAPTAALSKYQIKNPVTDEWEADPSPVTAKVYQSAGNPANWQYLIKPDYFYGKQVTKQFDAADLDASGIVELAKVPVMHPVPSGGGFDPLHPTFTVQGKRIDTEEWETISADDRLFVLPAGPSRVALKTQKPAEAVPTEEQPSAYGYGYGYTDGDTYGYGYGYEYVGGSADFFDVFGFNDFSDLTLTYSSFKITFWQQVPKNSKSCSQVGFARCKWAMPDPTKSVGNFNGTAKVDSSGNHWYCAKAVYTEFEEVDLHPEGNLDGIDDTAVGTDKAPSGLSRFPSNGQCLGHGTCDQFTPAEDDTGRDAPFRYEYHAARAYYELLGAADAKKQQYWPGFDVHFLRRVHHASIAWHLGYFGSLSTPTGIHGQAEFGYNGAWGTPHVETVTVDAGLPTEHTEQRLVTLTGHAYGYNNVTAPLEEDEVPVDGFFPANTLTTHRDPLDKAVSIVTKDLQRIGWRVRRDDGTLQGRGIAKSTVTVPAQDIVIPNVSQIEEGNQVRAMGSFVVDESGNGVLSILPLRPEQRSPETIGSREIYAVESVGDGKWQITFENSWQNWSQVDIGDPGTIGDSFDRIISFKAGGGKPCYGADFQQINAFENADKSFGSKLGGLCRGDALKIDGKLFIVDEVTPFGGEAATSWGNRQESGLYSPKGHWTAMPFTGEFGPHSSNDFIVYSSDNSPLTIIDDADRPDEIPEGSVWWDAENYTAIFSDADRNKGFYVNYSIDADPEDETDPVDHSVYHYTSDFQTDTNTDVGVWNAAVSKSIKADGLPMTINLSGDPARGVCVIDTTGTMLNVKTCCEDAVRTITITVEIDEPAPAPMDHYSTGGNYLSWAAKRDVVVVFDNDENWINSNAGSMAAMTADCVIQDAVMHPGATLEFTAYQSDAFAAVTEYSADCAGGTFTIPAATLATMPEKFCLKVKGAKLLDHRGLIPAELHNNMMTALHNMQWVTTTMSSGRSASFGFGRYGYQSWYFRHQELDENNELQCISAWDGYDKLIYDEIFPPDGNYLSMTGAPETSTSYKSTTSLSISSGFLGVPLAFMFLPDGTEILEAKAQIDCEGLTYYHKVEFLPQWDCDAGAWTEVDDPDEETEPSPTAINYDIIGFTSEHDFEVVGTILGANGTTEVRDFTTIAQFMFAHRSSGTYPYGYGIIFSPVGLSPDTEIPLLDEGTRAGVLCDVSEDPCPLATEEYVTQETLNMSWDNISISKVMLRVKYPDEEFTRQIIMPRWPSFKPLEV